MCEVIGPRGESATVVLLNEPSANLPSKDLRLYSWISVPLILGQRSFFGSRQQLMQTLMVGQGAETMRLLTPKWDICRSPSKVQGTLQKEYRRMERSVVNVVSWT